MLKSLLESRAIRGAAILGATAAMAVGGATSAHAAQRLYNTGSWYYNSTICNQTGQYEYNSRNVNRYINGLGWRNTYHHGWSCRGDGGKYLYQWY